jgi:hypothetical protein
MNALTDLEADMNAAALRMEDALFVEYWGESVAPNQRIAKWLTLADKIATDWIPSQVLFLKCK